MGDKIVASVVVVVYLRVAAASYRSDGGFMPSTAFQHTEDQLAEPSARIDKGSREDRDNQPDRTQRFGITSFGSTGSPYGSTAPGLYGPVKIDLGGVLLGSILGFGAVVILPKIIHAFSYSYGGGYGRSAESDLLVSDMFNKLDETLSRYNIDSAACMQRLTCSYVQLANENMATGNATEFDALLASISNNSLIRRMMGGTTIFEAMSAGRSSDTDCQVIYPKCKLDKKTVIKIMSQEDKMLLADD